MFTSGTPHFFYYSQNEIQFTLNQITYNFKKNVYVVIVYEGIFIKNKVIFLKKKVSQLFIQGLNFKEMA